MVTYLPDGTWCQMCKSWPVTEEFHYSAVDINRQPFMHQGLWRHKESVVGGTLHKPKTDDETSFEFEMKKSFQRASKVYFASSLFTSLAAHEVHPPKNAYVLHLYDRSVLPSSRKSVFKHILSYRNLEIYVLYGHNL